MIGSMGSVSSGSSESDLLALVRLLRDPAATEGKLAELAALRDENATLVANLSATQADVNSKLAKQEEQAAELAKQKADLDAAGAELAAKASALAGREREFSKASQIKAEEFSALTVELADRESKVVARETQANALVEKARADGEAAAALKTEYEEKLAKLRQIV